LYSALTVITLKVPSVLVKREAKMFYLKSTYRLGVLAGADWKSAKSANGASLAESTAERQHNSPNNLCSINHSKPT